MKKGIDMSAYSVDSMKRRMFEDELQNRLMLEDETYHDGEWTAVTEYLTKRINEIDKEYDSGYTGREK